MNANPALDMVNIEEEMKKSYLRFHSVIVGRARPMCATGSTCDRRVLFAIQTGGTILTDPKEIGESWAM
jgi:DNA gyrase/topoisomerase IV subunit A